MFRRLILRATLVVSLTIIGSPSATLWRNAVAGPRTRAQAATSATASWLGSTVRFANRHGVQVPIKLPRRSAVVTALALVAGAAVFCLPRAKTRLIREIAPRIKPALQRFDAPPQLFYVDHAPGSLRVRIAENLRHGRHPDGALADVFDIGMGPTLWARIFADHDWYDVDPNAPTVRESGERVGQGNHHRIHLGIDDQGHTVAVKVRLSPRERGWRGFQTDFEDGSDAAGQLVPIGGPAVFGEVRFIDFDGNRSYDPENWRSR